MLQQMATPGVSLHITTTLPHTMIIVAWDEIKEYFVNVPENAPFLLRHPTEEEHDEIIPEDQSDDEHSDQK